MQKINFTFSKMIQKNIVLCLVLVTLSENVKLPPNFQKCNRKQSNLTDCVLKAAQDGISQLSKSYPEINIPSLYPLEIPVATIGSGKGVVAVEQKFKNCKLYGFTQMKFDQFEFKFDKKNLEIAGVIPELKINCEYELDGKILLLPITGKGPATIILSALKVKAVCLYDEEKKKRKSFIKVTSCDIDMDPELIYFHFENLFDGNKELGDNINKVLNDNWKEVFADVKDGYIELIRQILVQLFNNFFSKISIEEAFD